MTPAERNRKWPTVRAKLKKEFERMQITVCELCGSSFALSFAHRYKRRFITTEEELSTVALLCAEHHNELEIGGHQRMFDEITKLINRRTER